MCVTLSLNVQPPVQCHPLLRTLAVTTPRWTLPSSWLRKPRRCSGKTGTGCSCGSWRSSSTSSRASHGPPPRRVWVAPLLPLRRLHPCLPAALPPQAHHRRRRHHRPSCLLVALLPRRLARPPRAQRPRPRLPLPSCRLAARQRRRARRLRRPRLCHQSLGQGHRLRLHPLLPLPSLAPRVLHRRRPRRHLLPSLAPRGPPHRRPLRRLQRAARARHLRRHPHPPKRVVHLVSTCSLFARSPVLSGPQV